MRRSKRYGTPARYPRSARVNEVLREVLAEEIEKLSDHDDRLGMLTVTSVDCDADLRHAKVRFASLAREESEALSSQRVRLQSAVAHQVRLKRTPQLSFGSDEIAESGNRVEEVLRRLARAEGNQSERNARPAS